MRALTQNTRIGIPKEVFGLLIDSTEVLPDDLRTRDIDILLRENATDGARAVLDAKGLACRTIRSGIAGVELLALTVFALDGQLHTPVSSFNIPIGCVVLTQRSAEPVSKSTVISWLGVPIPMGP